MVSLLLLVQYPFRLVCVGVQADSPAAQCALNARSPAEDVVCRVELSTAVMSSFEKRAVHFCK